MVPIELKDALASGDTIGYLIWFDCEKATITPSDLKRLFNMTGGISLSEIGVLKAVKA